MNDESEESVPTTSSKRASTSKYVEREPGMQNDLSQKISLLQTFKQFAGKEDKGTKGPLAGGFAFTFQCCNT